MKPNTIKHKLKLMGFEVINAGKSVYAFDFEKYHVLYMPDKRNPDCLRFALPCIFEVDDDTRQAVSEVVNHVNALVNYVKVFEIDEQIWVIYEHCLFGEEDESKLDDIIPHCLQALHVASLTFYNVIDGVEDFEGKEEAEDD